MCQQEALLNCYRLAKAVNNAARELSERVEQAHALSTCAIGASLCRPFSFGLAGASSNLAGAGKNHERSLFVDWMVRRR